jgi:OOP family OmpA-OmpF porin
VRRKALIGAIALALTSASAVAQDASHWYLMPHVGGVWTDDDRGLEDEDWLYGVTFGRNIGEAWALELNLNSSTLKSPAGNVEYSAASLDLLRFFAPKSAVSPYVALGVGALQNNPDLVPETNDFMVQGGFGLKIRLWQNEQGSRTFALRPQITARWVDAGRPDHFVDYVGMLGFQISFGAAPVAAALPAPAPAPAPAPEPAPAPVPPPPPDTDRDGVLDSTDRCPGTPRGVAVDAVGCTQKGSITLEGVTFEVNSADLTAESRPVLERVAADLKKYPQLRVELEGHTDASGADRYNLQLSERRAQSVRDYLINVGVPARQVEARGYGETKPIASNDTPQGRALNRRVVMSVLDNPGDVNVEVETPR